VGCRGAAGDYAIASQPNCLWSVAGAHKAMSVCMYVFITPGGTKPKGPFASYLVTVRKLVLFTRESPYIFPSFTPSFASCLGC